jgi:cation:H+ antiporter
MEEWIHSLILGKPLPGLLMIIAVFIYTLGKGADLLVEEAVTISIRWGLPRLLVGATVVSLGTTFPEAAVSVLAAIKGEPGLALGNAVGSIICDTGLILGIAALMAPLPLQKSVVNRQGWLQLGAGFLLVFSCLPYSSLDSAFTTGGRLPRVMGFVFLILLVAYMWLSVRWVKGAGADAEVTEDPYDTKIDAGNNSGAIAAKFIFAIALVVGSSQVLIPTVQETALRMGVPNSIIAATLVAFGTSLPELVTAVTAVLKGHGELAIGNVIGADILNVLFVAGASAAVTSGGLSAPSHFFTILFPAMLFILLVFRVGVYFSEGTLKRPFGAVLLGSYILVTVISYSNISH